jgi:predicted nucleic-acid-binding protein
MENSSKNCSIDTNIVLRWLLDDVPEQTLRIEKVFNSKEVKKIYIADIVLAEVVWVLKSYYKFEKTDLVQMLQTVLSFPKFVANKSLFENVIAQFLEASSVSFVDLMILNYAKLNEALPLFSLDKNLVKIDPNVKEI